MSGAEGGGRWEKLEFKNFSLSNAGPGLFFSRGLLPLSLSERNMNQEGRKKGRGPRTN